MKTINLINRYFQIIEQGEQTLDATEPNGNQLQQAVTDNTTATSKPTPEQKISPLTPAREQALLELIIQSYAHAPDSNEITIVDDVYEEFMNTNPRDIGATIQMLLGGGTEELTSELDKLPA